MKTALIALLFAAACNGLPSEPTEEQPRSAGETRFQKLRERMVERDIAARDVSDPAVLEAVRRVPRHEFVPAAVRHLAYEDYPLSIGYGQTISQPYIVAKMTELLGVRRGDKVLEVGTGSGYQAAVLAELGCQVYSIEIVPELAKQAGQTLQRLGYDQVHVRAGDGYAGWPAAAPFDGIIVTAAPDHVPQPLIEQLAEEASLVIPVGASGGIQELRRLTRQSGEVLKEHIFAVRFVPMTGKAQDG